MFHDAENRRELAKWVISVITACILIYLGFRHIASIAAAISWLVDLVHPLLVGMIVALILNVPMSFMESKLLCSRINRGKRGLAIILSLLLVLGIFVGVSILVVPELLAALKLIVEIISNSLGQLAILGEQSTISGYPLAEQLVGPHIDWAGLQLQLEEWVKTIGSEAAGFAIDAAGSLIDFIITTFVALTFAIYILARKETLKRQIGRLIRVWLPKQLGETMIHVTSVCSGTFKLFVAGQATEAIILGTLCMIGMAILRIPYAPMVGALVGVTALIPIMGAWIGAIVATIMILTVDPFKAVLFVVFLLILQQVEGNAIYPRVVGSKLNLPAIWVLAAITVGGNLAGPFGMLLGVPIASSAYTLLKEATANRERRIYAMAQAADANRADCEK